MRLEGWYHDPKHGHCLRRILRVSPGVYTIVGVYGDDETPRTHQAWTARVTTPDGRHLRVDFGGKTLLSHARVYRATYDGARRIDWEDGNHWTRLYVHPAQLR